MAKPSAFVKISGSLLGNPAVIEWLRELTKIYFVAVCIGGGDQINEAFKQRGFPIIFGLLGRITVSLEERQLARDILEQNQAFVQDLFDENGISARAIIPVEDIGSVLCHVNGDILLLAAYNGYDKLFLLTTKDRVKKKRLWLQRVARVFAVIAQGDSIEQKKKPKLDKIKVVGF